MRRLEVHERLVELVEGIVVVEGAGHEVDAVGDAPPDVVAELGPGVVLGGGTGELLEVAVVPVPAGESQQHETRREQSPIAQVVDRRDELLACEVACHPEDDEGARVGNA